MRMKSGNGTADREASMERLAESSREEDEGGRMAFELTLWASGFALSAFKSRIGAHTRSISHL